MWQVAFQCLEHHGAEHMLSVELFDSRDCGVEADKDALGPRQPTRVAAGLLPVKQ